MAKPIEQIACDYAKAMGRASAILGWIESEMLGDGPCDFDLARRYLGAAIERFRADEKEAGRHD